MTVSTHIPDGVLPIGQLRAAGRNAPRPLVRG